MRHIERKIFPVCLLLENKPCLVVGGGNVASRKIQLLLDAGAVVTVIAPTITEEIHKLVESKTIFYINREVASSDLLGFKVVYCATNDNSTNLQVLTFCRDRQILCCIVDSGWTEGDFLTPATVRQDDLTVSISTGGKACRRTRLVKASLSQYLSLMDNSTLAVIGTSHLQLSTERREPIHCSGDTYIQKANMIGQIRGVHEFILLNTCNRIELYMTGSVSPDLRLLLCRILLLDTLDVNEYYFKEGVDAFEHGVALCSGLLSQLPGEHHITAQLKDTVSSCISASWAGTIMQEWFSSTLHLSREVRQATAPYLKSEEFEDIAVKYISSELKNRDQLSIIILGTGMVGTEVLNKVLSSFPNATVEWIYHNRIPEVPVFFKDRIVLSSFDNLSDKLQNADVIISAVRSDKAVITTEHIPFINHESLLIDLSIPRTIDPSIKIAAENLRIIDLDYLKKWYRIEQVDRSELLLICKNIVQANKEMYVKFITSITGRNP